MNKRTMLALGIAGLLAAIGIIYLISAYQEPIQAAEEQQQESGGSNSSSGMDLATEMQTAFFTVSGLASLGVAAWILLTRKHTTKTPYIVAAAGSAFLIVFYIASRTVSLPIVGIQSDVGSVEILCKVLQAIVVALSVYAISVTTRLRSEIKARSTTS
jgi:hypothetical protein